MTVGRWVHDNRMPPRCNVAIMVLNGFEPAPSQLSRMDCARSPLPKFNELRGNTHSSLTDPFLGAYGRKMPRRSAGNQRDCDEYENGSLLPTGSGQLSPSCGRTACAERCERRLALTRDAPFAVVAHDTASDPVFVYANLATQRCFEYDWEEFVRLPSRLSAEAPNRKEREQLLARVSRDGYASGYRRSRISQSGRRFFIEDGVVWQLIGPDGQVHGQAATFLDPGVGSH